MADVKKPAQRASPPEINERLLTALKHGKQSITELSKRSGVNRITASGYLHSFERAGIVKRSSEGRETIFMLRDNPNSHFDLPVTRREKELFDTYYAYITEFCKKRFDKEPTKTQAYKILWELNKELELDLPIGWYMHGPCAVQIYRGTEQASMKLDAATRKQVREKTEEYCALEPLKLQRRIYAQEKNQLYLAKEALIHHENKQQLRAALLKLVQFSPDEVKPLVSDFANTAMCIEWRYVAPTFQKLWEYIARIEFKESEHIKSKYPDIDDLFRRKIDHLQHDIAIEIQTLIQNHVKIDSLEDFQKAIRVWEKQSIPKKTPEEERRIVDEFVKEKSAALRKLPRDDM